MGARIIGSKIAKARKENNLSQAQLAEQLFISPQAVGKWERGESIPDIMTCIRLAQILRIDLNYFSENVQSEANETASGIATNRNEIEQKVQESTASDRPDLTNFNGSNLPDSDFAGVIAHKRKFNGSALRGSNFSGADLTGSSFISSDVREANFDATNLTDCVLSTSDFSNASFNKAFLVRTELNKLGLIGTKFSETKLVDVKLTMTDLRQTLFENCAFEGVDFNYGDMRGLSLNGLTFIGVTFNKTALNDVSFKGATLKNVSFRSTYVLTSKYYRAIKTICFDGAMMDKLTLAALKGLGADLSKVIIT